MLLVHLYQAVHKPPKRFAIEYLVIPFRWILRPSREFEEDFEIAIAADHNAECLDRPNSRHPSIRFVASAHPSVGFQKLDAWFLRYLVRCRWMLTYGDRARLTYDGLRPGKLRY